MTFFSPKARIRGLDLLKLNMI